MVTAHKTKSYSAVVVPMIPRFVRPEKNAVHPDKNVEKRFRKQRKKKNGVREDTNQYLLKDFATAWKQLTFSRIHELRSPQTSADDFTQEMFAEALRSIKPTATVPILIAAFFSLYALHASQPGSERIRVSISAMIAIQIALNKLSQASDTCKGAREAMALWQRLYTNDRIEFAAYVGSVNELNVRVRCSKVNFYLFYSYNPSNYFNTGAQGAERSKQNP